MKDCRYFEDELLAGIPYRFRAHVEETLRSIQESKVMIQLISNAIISVSKVCEASEMPDMVLAIGSFGRLDGCAKLSDYDIVYVYDGPFSEIRVQNIRKTIRKIVSDNKALTFDHREAIENGTFDFDNSPAYPVLSLDELRKSDNEIRILQIFTEGRVIIGEDKIAEFKSRELEGFGYTANKHSFDLTPLRDALSRMKNAFCRDFIGRLKTENRKLTNRKILKLFVLREFFYLSSLFALADICISFSVSQISKHEALRKLSAPSILKISTFSDPNGSLGKLLSRNRPAVRDQISKMLSKQIEAMPRLIRGAVMDETTDAGEAQLFPVLRALILSVLNKYDSLLQLLHDHDFLDMIEPLAPDVTTWMSIRKFRRILERREEMIDAAKLLAASLKDILVLENELDENSTFGLGVESLQAIVAYELELR